MLSKIKDYLRENDSRLSEWLFCHYYEKREKRNASLCGISLSREKGEEEYKDKWKKILRFPTPYAYRFYSKFVGLTPNIVSQTAANKINNFLNPPRYLGYLSDKNTFDNIFPSAPFPETFLRKIDGQLYDNHYNAISWNAISSKRLNELIGNFDKIIVKETLDSDSGRGIIMFRRIGSQYIRKNKNKEVDMLSIDWLKQYPTDFIMQEGLTQNDFMARFNTSSINTIRVAVYRSVIDNEPHVLSTVIRMGMKDSVIDNLHGGGRMVKVGEDGLLADFCIDQYGRKFDAHNDVNFKLETLRLPYYREIHNLVKNLTRELTYSHLIQWDVAIDGQDNLRILEFNLTGFSMWIAQMNGIPAYGNYTDEIINYVASRIRK